MSQVQEPSQVMLAPITKGHIGAYDGVGVLQGFGRRETMLEFLALDAMDLDR